MNIQLFSGDAPVSLDSHPSLLALIHAHSRSVESVEADIARIAADIEELEARAVLLESLGQSVKGVRNKITRRQSQRLAAYERLAAYRANYIEVPNPDGYPIAISGTDNDMGEWVWGSQLPADTPLDVLRALKHARDKGVFSEFRIMLPKGRVKVDPMIYGIAGDACFYVASWR